MIQNGNNIRIRIGNVEIPSLTSVSADFTREMIIITSRPTNGYMERTPGNRTGSLSFEGFFDAQVDRLDIGTLIQWAFLGRGREFTGQGYITDMSITGGTDEAPTRSGSIEVTGPIASFEVNINEALRDREVQLCDAGEDLFTLL